MEIRVEPKSQRYRGTPLVWRAKAEPMACGSKAEMGTLKTVVKPEGRQSLVEPKE